MRGETRAPERPESGFQTTIRDEPRTYAKRTNLTRTQEVSGSRQTNRGRAGSPLV
jgi:hypothetical protein